MKKMLTISLLLISLCATAQSEAFSLSQVVQADGKTKDELYNSVKLFVADAYRSAKDVIQLDDKEIGIIVLTGRESYSPTNALLVCYSGWVSYSLKIQVKDNRLKVDMSDLIHSNRPGNASSCEIGLILAAEKQSQDFYKVAPKIKTEMTSFFNNFVFALDKHIKNSTTNDNW